MVIDNFHIIRAQVCPHKTYTVSLIDPNAVLPFAISNQSL